MRTPSRQLLLLLTGCAVGVAVILGLAVAHWLGTTAAVLYALVVASLLLDAVRRGYGAKKRAQQRAADGRSCTCCTTSQHDPVRVI